MTLSPTLDGFAMETREWRVSVDVFIWLPTPYSSPHRAPDSLSCCLQVTPEMRIAWEEPFGPVIPVVRVPNVEAAIDHCNTNNLALQVWLSYVAIRQPVTRQKPAMSRMLIPRCAATKRLFSHPVCWLPTRSSAAVQQ